MTGKNTEGKMLNAETENLARELLAAQEQGQMVPLPPSARPGFDLDKAYAVESLLKGWHVAGGHRSVGRKVGYANKAMWRMLKLETLVWAHMYEDTVHDFADNSATLALKNSRSLKIEPEIVFGLKHAIGLETNDAESALKASEWLAMGFEIIDCPFPEWRFQPGDFVASFGLHAALVVGERKKVDAQMIPKLVEELAQFKVQMFKNDQLIEEGAGRNALRSPALCLAELGRAIARRFADEPLTAGEIVSTGTLTAGHAITTGDRWTAKLEGLRLPSLTLTLG
jgi:2-oxo-3-hexenedioate decarboxylase